MKEKLFILGVMVLLAGFAVHGHDILLVRNKPGTDTRQAEVNRFHRILRDRLNRLGIATQSVWDHDDLNQALAEAKLAILPYNPDLSAATQSKLTAFVGRGGKLAIFYLSPPSLLSLLDIDRLVYVGSDKLPPLHGIYFDRDSLPEAPEVFLQASHNIHEPKLKLGGSARIVGQWIGQDGKTTQLNAAVLHNNGFYLSHVYMDQDVNSGSQLLQAVLGHLVPELWPQLAQKAYEQIGRLAGMETYEQLTTRIQQFANPEANRNLDLARRWRDQTLSALNQRQYKIALDNAKQARQAAEQAYLATCASRIGELRGAWLHSPYGIGDWGWDRTIKVLADNGFNAMFPNFCWGYVADYHSEVLPVHPDVAVKGDLLQQCLDACQKYGVEIHVWKVNWNMGHRTPKAYREQMRQAGRTQVKANGGVTDYLSPHRQDNFELERDAMLEMVRKYPINGIHFDYIRYPDSSCDFSDDARKAFEANLGSKVPNWPGDCTSGGKLRKEYNLWRQNNISRLVEAVYKGAKEVRPDIKVSAAVFGGWEMATESIAQNAQLWIENGWLDFVCPMNYTTDLKYLRRLLTDQVQRVNGKILVYCGIGNYLHDGAVMTGSQVEMARALGADGVVCFDLRRSLVEDILPKLGRNIFAEQAGAVLPHHVPTPPYTMPTGRQDLENGLLVGDAIAVRVELPPKVAQNRRLQVAFTCDGRVALNNKEVQIRRQGNKLTATAKTALPGYYRLELSCPEQAFLSRSPVCRVYGQEEAAEVRQLQGPPPFVRRRVLRVGVWQHDAYGAAELLRVLQQQQDLEALPLLNLKPASLAACQVVLLPQPRQQLALFKNAATAADLSDFVRQGGGLLTTHALVGIRGFINPIPHVVANAEEKALSGAEWKIMGGHAVTAGISRGILTSTFNDRIKLTPAKSGTVVVTTDRNEPVMVVGAYGRGRYAACGLGLGIGINDQDAPPSPAEARLLLNTVRWLGK